MITGRARVRHVNGGALGTVVAIRDGAIPYYVIWDDHARDTWFSEHVLVVVKDETTPVSEEPLITDSESNQYRLVEFFDHDSQRRLYGLEFVRRLKDD